MADTSQAEAESARPYEEHREQAGATHASRLALYDIHGNPDALDAVLADPRAQGADVVLVGGDVVPGALARQALDRLDGLAVPVRWVRGNGEREVAAAAAGGD